MRLVIDEGAFEREYQRVLLEQISIYEGNLAKEIERNFETAFGFKYGKIENEIDTSKLKERIRIKIKANAMALMDIYGTGSKMDTSNPVLDDYINSDMWNHYRSKSDTTIRGRDAGTYTNVFGKTVESSGAFAGLNMEGRIIPNKDNDGEGYIEIKAQDPSHAVEKGIEQFVKDSVQDIWHNTIQNMDLAKCMIYK